DRLRFAEHRLLLSADVLGEQHLTTRRADDQVEFAVAVPVEGEHARPVGRVHRLAVGVRERHAAREPLAVAPEQRDLPRPRAREDARLAVAAEVHQLWTEADISPRLDGAERVAGLEPFEVTELRVLRRADVPVDAQLAAAELAEEQVGLAVAVEVADER